MLPVRGCRGNRLCFRLCALFLRAPVGMATEATESRLQIALGIDQEIRAHHDRLAFFDAFNNLDVTLPSYAELNRSWLERAQ